MKNKHYFISAVLLFSVLLCMLPGCGRNMRPAGDDPVFTNSSDYECEIDIKPVVFKKFGQHIYYPEGKFFAEEKYPGKNDAIREYFEIKDSEEKANIYVFDYIVNGRDGRLTSIQLYGREYVNGIIIEDKPYYAQDVKEVKHFTRMFGGKRQHVPVRSMAVDPETVLPKVAELASQNRGSMLMDRGNTIYGTYLLKYIDTKDYLYYEFTLNCYSTIKVNARTGEIDDAKFDNGASEFVEAA